MHRTSNLCSFVFIFIQLCHGSNGADTQDIFLTIIRNNTKNVYHESQNIEFKEQDVLSTSVDITCSITRNTYYNNEPPILTWTEDDTDWQPRPNGVSISYRKVLTAEDDGKELKCMAWSKAKDRKWTISVNFNKKKTAREIILAKPNSFKTMLIAIGAVIGGAIALILCYGLIKRLKKNIRDEEHGSDDSLGTKNVVYSEIDISNKKKNNMTQKFDEPLYCQIGMDNKGCQIQEDGAHVNFHGLNSDDNKKSDSLVTLSSRLENPELRKSVGNLTNPENKISLSLKNTNSSSDC